MTDLPFLFVATALLAAVLASIAVWAPRKLAVRAGAVACFALLMPVAYAGFSDLLSRPKPVALEWWLGKAEEATVLGAQTQEPDSLFVWLQLDGAPEPVAGLQERQLQRQPALPRQLDRPVRRGEPADAAPDDDELYRASLTRWASMAMNSGWSFTELARWSAMPCCWAIARASTSRS